MISLTAPVVKTPVVQLPDRLNLSTSDDRFVETQLQYCRVPNEALDMAQRETNDEP